MNPRHFEAIIAFVALSAAGWLVYKLLDKVGDSAAAAGDLIGDGIAAVIIPPPVHVVGGAVLPNGVIVTWDQVVASGSSLGNDNSFTWQGVRYKTNTRRSDGLFVAVKA